MLQKIEHLLASLSSAERRVGQWVLDHPRQAADSTLAVVARETGASEPTVIRFCRSVGLDGFRDLTLRLTEALSRPASYVHRDVSVDDATPDAIAKVIDASIQALVDLRGRLATLPVDPAVAVLQKARQIIFFGLGASGHVAQDACHKFFRLGRPCAAMTDSPTILQFASIASAADVIVVISTRGRWPETIEAVRQATANGATVIAITDPSSELADTASLVLAGEAAEDTSVYTPMSSRLAQLALLDALHVSMALALGEAASDKLRASKAVISRHFSG